MVTGKRLNHAWERDHNVLVLQGGGALGAYQAGVYEEVSTTRYQPSWVAGVSIGAINAALIVGNLPQRRVERLREFWHMVSSGLVAVPVLPFDAARAVFNRVSASLAATAGVPGFYQPRLATLFAPTDGVEGARSVYDATPLRETLLQMVDFDLINSKHVRLSVGAVDVMTGNSRYFDNLEQEIRPEHIMASGALPPAFEAVEIDGSSYWDGGLVSNTPLQHVLDVRGKHSLMVLQVDLFSAKGSNPINVSAAMARQKDILYSSRTRYSTDMATKIQKTCDTMREILAALPAKVRDDPGIKKLQAFVRQSPVDIVHMIYRQKPYELESKDYEFSRVSVLDHWRAGRRDMRETLDHPEWLAHAGGLDDGVSIYDLARPDEQRLEHS
jgi:NTE family protein